MTATATDPTPEQCAAMGHPRRQGPSLTCYCHPVILCGAGCERPVEGHGDYCWRCAQDLNR